MGRAVQCHPQRLPAFAVAMWAALALFMLLGCWTPVAAQHRYSAQTRGGDGVTRIMIGATCGRPAILIGAQSAVDACLLCIHAAAWFALNIGAGREARRPLGSQLSRPFPARQFPATPCPRSDAGGIGGFLDSHVHHQHAPGESWLLPGSFHHARRELAARSERRASPPSPQTLQYFWKDRLADDIQVCAPEYPHLARRRLCKAAVPTFLAPLRPRSSRGARRSVASSSTTATCSSSISWRCAGGVWLKSSKPTLCSCAPATHIAVPRLCAAE